MSDGGGRGDVKTVRDNIECDYKHIKLIIEMINPRKTINIHSLIKSPLSVSNKSMRGCFGVVSIVSIDHTIYLSSVI